MKEINPLTKEERTKIRLMNGDSWKYSTGIRYEATLQLLEDQIEHLKSLVPAQKLAQIPAQKLAQTI